MICPPVGENQALHYFLFFAFIPFHIDRRGDSAG